MSLLFVALLVAGGVVVAGLVSFVVTFYVVSRRASIEHATFEGQHQQRLMEVEAASKERLLEAKEEAVKIRSGAEQEAREIRAQAQQVERRLLQKEENLDRRTEELSRREEALATRERGQEELRAQLEETYAAQLRELERVAQMSRQEAQGLVMAQVEQDLRNEVARKVRDAELSFREESERRARTIVTEVIQRIAADQTAETSVSV